MTDDKEKAMQLRVQQEVQKNTGRPATGNKVIRRGPARIRGGKKDAKA